MQQGRTSGVALTEDTISAFRSIFIGSEFDLKVGTTRSRTNGASTLVRGRFLLALGPLKGKSGPTEQPAALISQKRQCPCQNAHVDPLEERPFPGIGLAPNYRDGADALQSENVKDHQSNRN